jgi:pimeloyl-ACP methyl ester carboxylesterase
VRRAAIVVCVLLLGACGSAGTTAKHAAATTTTTRASLTRPFTGADIYAVPKTLPKGTHGDLLRYAPVDAGLGVPTYKVLYLSESVAGDPIAVSGIVAVPKAATTVLTWAHGTTGIADVCAPSKDPAGAVGFLKPFVDRGWAVAATDYEGLGTPGRHPYISGPSEGRGTLDIVRAIAQVPPTMTVGKVVVWGHSQGGHAALFAGQLAKTWTPELDVVGVVAGAPATELPLIAKALQNTPFSGYLALGAAGLNAAEPTRADLSIVLTKEALDRLHVIDEACADKVNEVFDALPYDHFAKADPGEVEPWRSILLENDPGHAKTDVPIYLYQGENDEQIPVAASKLLFDRLCGLGQVVERHTYPGQSHAGVIGVAFSAFSDWMDARVAGTPLRSGCPSG